jgi:NAD(P)-dependent dehydrogenase (short-subunit alcohol dehydrogenase family)
MVCNARRTKHKAALDYTTEEIDQLWGVNLDESFYSARCAARAFIKQGVKGSIVFTASMASYRPNEVNFPLSFGLQALVLLIYSAFPRHRMALPKPVCAI